MIHVRVGEFVFFISFSHVINVKPLDSLFTDDIDQTIQNLIYLRATK